MSMWVDFMVIDKLEFDILFNLVCDCILMGKYGFKCLY